MALWEFGPVSEPVPMGDVARAHRKDRVANQKAGVVFEKQGSQLGRTPPLTQSQRGGENPSFCPSEHQALLAIHKTIPPSAASHRYNLSFTDRIEGL